MVPIHSDMAAVKISNASETHRHSQFGCWMLDVGCWMFICLLFVTAAPTTRAADTNALLSNWIAAQTNIHTWSADVVQTRTLKSLSKPLTAYGHVWFEAPSRFHWELTNPTPSIAIRSADEMLVIYPKLK